MRSLLGFALHFAQLLGTATDQLSLELGQTLSGLLNASFGNAVEIIVGIAALFQGQLRIVQTSVSTLFSVSVSQLLTAGCLQLLGSILSNLLLVLGCSFLAGVFFPVYRHILSLTDASPISTGGMKVNENNFAVTAAQTCV